MKVMKIVKQELNKVLNRNDHFHSIYKKTAYYSIKKVRSLLALQKYRMGLILNPGELVKSKMCSRSREIPGWHSSRKRQDSDV